jgi:hypothetical protein
MKGQRLFDVVGNSYHLETRVTSNRKANRDRAIRLARMKDTESAVGQTHAKRAWDADGKEEPSNETGAPKTSNKRTKVNRDTHLSAFTSDQALVEAVTQPKATRSRTDTVRSRTITSTVSTAGQGVVSASSNSAEVNTESGDHDSPAADPLPKDPREAPDVHKSSKRVFSQIFMEDEYEHKDAKSAVAPVKKAKPSSKATAATKKQAVKARAESTAAS